MSLGLAATGSGHRIVAVVGRDREAAVAGAASVGARAAGIGEPLGRGDLLVLAVRDAAIAEVATSLAPAAGYHAAVHLSGFTPVAALAPLADGGRHTGSFHPLQTLSRAEDGAARLAGAHVAVTAKEPLRQLLWNLALSLGAAPFDLADEAKPLYHAGASAAANFPLAALAMAADLLEAAKVPFAAARPLVEAVVGNAFELGPRAALTGPVARGDVATVTGQAGAVHDAAPEWLEGFVAFVRELARISGGAGDFEALVGGWRPEDGG